MPNINQTEVKDRMYILHELVLNTLEYRLNADDVTSKDIELAMKFLKDNQILVDLTAGKKTIKDTISRIPRLTTEELRLSA